MARTTNVAGGEGNDNLPRAASDWVSLDRLTPTGDGIASLEGGLALHALLPASGDPPPANPPRPPFDSWGDSSAGKPGLPIFLPTGNSAVAGGYAAPGKASPFPEVGTTFLDFHLVAELGRGTFGRVYLARQGGLADRFVALKVSTETMAESQKLARLQHTHIVPVYSVHQAGYGPHTVQAVCMPYFGSTTLADVLFDLSRRHSLPHSGRDLVSTLNDRKGRTFAALTQGSSGLADGSLPASEPEPGPEKEPHEPADKRPLNLQRLEGLSYVEVVLWIGARLADGLAHAHERGILHRDLKPANVLLTDDGQPMLLDFNLSEDTKPNAGAGPAPESGQARKAQVGGTVPYMAPEHLAAFAGLPPPYPQASISPRSRVAHGALAGLAHPTGAQACLPGSTSAVDARSDVYALGLLLYELLTGRYPFARHPGPIEQTIPRMLQERLQPLPPAGTFLRPWNQAVSPAVESIVRHCLEPDPARRYQSARQLSEDLERQIESLPLAHAPEPSLEERLRKWTRRHPRLTSSTSVAVLAMVLVLTLGSILVVSRQRLARFEAGGQYNSFREELQAARLLAGSRGDSDEARAEGETLARRALERYGVLTALAPESKAERQRRQPSAPAPGPGTPPWLQSPAYRHLSQAERELLEPELGEALLLLAGWANVSAQDKAEPRKWQEALKWNELAEACYPPGQAPRSVWAQRADLLDRLGQRDEAHIWRGRAQETPVRDGWDHYLLARQAVQQGRYREAVQGLKRLVEDEPRNFAALFLLGNCCLDGYADSVSAPSRVAHGALAGARSPYGSSGRLGREQEAIIHYSACVALQPSFHGSYFNRGLAYLRTRQFEQAEADFRRVLALRPNLTEAAVLRALAYEGSGRDREALAELDRAHEGGNRSTRLFLVRARIKGRLGDLAGARLDREEGRKRVPTDEESWIARGVERVRTDPAGALADFAQAVKLNPSSLAGLHNQAHVLSEQLGQTGEAIAMLDRVLTLHPHLVQAWAGRGVLHARSGQRDKAHRDAHEALSRDPQGGETLFQVAGVYALTAKTHPEDRNEAVRLLAKALQRGFGYALLETDTDLAGVRDDERFRELVRAARTLKARAAER